MLIKPSGSSTHPRYKSSPAVHLGGVAVALGFAVVAALLLMPLFIIPFVVLLARTVFMALLLLAAFVAMQRVPDAWLPGWLPRWLATLLGVGLAAPVGTLLVYLVSVDGRFGDLFSSMPRRSGFVITTVTALILGLVITLTALLREREARARALALEVELERQRLEKLSVDTRLAQLQAQIEPHFLFNTLASVQALVESNSPRAAGVLQSLIAYLRAAMPRLQERDALLADELTLVRAYLALMQMRMPDRLRFNIDVPAALEAQRFPAMALLTLVENSVRHGIDPSEDGGTVQVGATLTHEGLQLWVSDDGVGINDKAPAGTGLSNLRERLAAFFGPSARLELQHNLPHGLRASIIVPGVKP